MSPGFKRPLSKEVTSLYRLFFAFVCSIDEVEVLCSVLGYSLFSEVVDLLCEQVTKTVAEIKMIDVENSFFTVLILSKWTGFYYLFLVHEKP